MKHPIILLTLALLTACQHPAFVNIQDSHFYLPNADTPTYFVGTNLWYAPILASTGNGGDRMLLAQELDHLQSLGINNIRVLIGGDGSNGIPSHIEPTLQVAPSTYNDTILDGLDYLIAQLDQRHMYVVLYLNNAWEWSGGYSQYVEWTTNTPAPIPNVDGWSQYINYAQQFINSDTAQALFDQHIQHIITRKNRYTGRTYNEEPSIFAWQIANEPRAFTNDNKTRFAAWISHVAALIKSLDNNHLLSIGTEGIWGCEMDTALFIQLHADTNIDYATCHIWPYNWSWIDTNNMQASMSQCLTNTADYIDEHANIMRRLHKPLVIEEFGFPRDGMSISPNSSTNYRDQYYQFIFDYVTRSAAMGDILAGCNFWGWATNIPLHDTWQQGDPYCGDPAQEPQGLNSVFPTDTTTLQRIGHTNHNMPKMLPKPNLAPTPPMGWNSWNKFSCNISADLIRKTADLLVSTGLRDAGYVYLNMDDCWHGQRDSLGFIHPDTTRFPDDLSILSDYIHQQGLKFGIYSDAGTATCGGRPGSLGHEQQDADTYAKWGVDYLKYDWCSTTGIDSRDAYTKMAYALRSTGRDIYFSLCEWGDTKAYQWGADVGHSWRTTGDIWCAFDSVYHHDDWCQWGVMQIADMTEPLRRFAGANHWNDPDMLEVGNGMTEVEDESHFALWCMLAAPLIIGCDLETMTPHTLNLLTNKDLIAINQDPLAIPAYRYTTHYNNGDSTQKGIEYWFRPLSGNRWAVQILNRTHQPQSFYTDWQSLAHTDSLSHRTFNPTIYNTITPILCSTTETTKTTDAPLYLHLDTHESAVFLLSE